MTDKTPNFCSLCGSLWQGQGAVFKDPAGHGRGLAVCAGCLRTAGRCPACTRLVRADHSGLCPACGADLRRCLSCGRVIGGRYVEIGGRGPFCMDCFETRPACANCGAPVGPEGQLLPDDRHLCLTCHQTAIYDEPAAQTMLVQVKTIINRDLGLALNIPTPLYLADRRQLQAVVNRLGRRAKTIPPDTLGFYLRQGRRRGIYVLSGLPPALLTVTLAHEYAHAWQAERNPFGGDLLLWEGFAEWVAYKTLACLGQTEAMRQMEVRPDVYGQGLRQMLEIEQESSIAGVLQAARRGKTS